MLLAGIQITSNVIIGGGSVVVKDVTESGIYVGNPIKKLGEVPKDYWVDGESKQYEFDKDILEKYLPNIILEANPHKKIAE